MIDINREVTLTIPVDIPAFNRISNGRVLKLYSTRERNMSILFKAKFSATSFVVKINPYKVELC